MKAVMLILLVVLISGASASAALVLVNGDLASPLTAQTTISGDGNGNGAEPVMFDQFVAPNTGGRRFGWSNTDPKYQAMVHEQTSTPGRNRGFYYAFDDNRETTGATTLNFTFVNETTFNVDVGVGFFGWNEGDAVLMDLGGNVSVAECIPNTTGYQIGMTVLGEVDYFTSAVPEVIQYSHTFNFGTTAYDNIAFVVFVRTTQDTTFTIAANGGTGPTFYFDDFSLGEGTRESAKTPRPADGQTDVPRDGIVLEWTAGESAASHDVYLGTSLEDVNTATHATPVFMGNQAETVFPLGYRPEFGQSYYWRIDEVAPDGKVYRGVVWGFTVEPFAYPIENVNATASSTNKATEGPENTINGSGLEDGDLHSVEPTGMWLSSITGPQPTWIQYEFERVYKLHQMQVWNYNTSVEPVIGFGIKEATVEYSADGAAWATLGTTHEFGRGPGADGYAPSTTVELGGVAAKYVKITANSNWGGIVNQYGLSEVRFLYIPVFAREPDPASGATDIGVDTTLSWRMGREAAKHDVYLSTDEQAVIDGTTPAVTVISPSYTCSLDLASTYYWRVDEVNEAEIPTTWQGDIWSFSTPEYLIVDDFESYNDVDPPDPKSHRIFEAWIDGFGITTNGALIGYDPPQPSYAERITVHGGRQSMPLFYSNTSGATYSEGVRTFAVPQDWTKHDVKTLGLFFSGTSGNTGQLYVKINGSKIPYVGAAGDLALAGWHAWNIDLTASGLNLQNVSILAIGVDGSGAGGTLYFDDIRLYPYERQFITPMQPDPAGLFAHWKFDEGSGTVAHDSSGKGHDGTFNGAPQWVDGPSGRALRFNGMVDFVEYDLGADQTWSAYSVGLWAKGDTVGMAQYKSVFSSHTPNNFGFQMDVDGANPGSYRYSGVGAGIGRYGPLTTEWVHLATICDGSTTTLYYNGDAAATMNGADLVFNRIGVGVNRNEDYLYEGVIDEFRIYDRVLTREEIAGLAGRTQPFDKPF